MIRLSSVGMYEFHDSNHPSFTIYAAPDVLRAPAVEIIYIAFQASLK